MKFRAYIYPRTSRGKNTTNNPYVNHFMKSLEERVDFLNKTKPTGRGIFNLLFYIHKIDYLFLNWIEDLPDKKFGYLQYLFFWLFLRIKKSLSIKVVWTIHNKFSHNEKNLIIKRFLIKELLKRADIIITHAKEGIQFAESLIPGSSTKVFYFPHPIVPISLNRNDTPKRFDALIWGSMAPYKGIYEFLSFLKREGQDTRFRILIAGKAVSEEFYEDLKKFENNFITIRNDFINREELTTLIEESAMVLFTYAGDSVLSSGALIDSIAHYACIVGPNRGAFKEMAELGIISIYNNFDELLRLLNSYDPNQCKLRYAKISDFIENHTWEKFGKAFQKNL